MRVLIANERPDRLADVAAIVMSLGHEVIAREVDVAEVGAATVRERPDVALVGLGVSSEHALDLIDKIVHEATCPVIALLHAPDPAFVTEAAKRGVFAYIDDDEPAAWQTRSRSSCCALRNTTTSKERLDAAPSPNGQKES
jgi:response regulator NasT